MIGLATLYLADCFDVLPTLERVDAVITDPPYGIGYAANPIVGKGKTASNHARSDWDAEKVRDIHAARALGEFQIIWGGNYYELPPSRGWLSWFKPDAPPSMAHFEMAWTNQDRNARQISCSIGETNAERVGHPTQKPLRVMRWCIEQADMPRTTLDPFMGSGTTGMACVGLGLAFVGIEINPDYFALACRRIENAQRQRRIFG